MSRFSNKCILITGGTNGIGLAGANRIAAEGDEVIVKSSTAACEEAPMATTYAATKGALVAITRGWASALGGRQIRLNALVPGAISTNFRDFTDKDFRAKSNRPSSGLQWPEISS